MGDQQPERDGPPPYRGLEWNGRYDDTASHRARETDSGYPVRWVGTPGDPASYRPFWRESGRPVGEQEHAVFDRWQEHRVVASGISQEEARELSDRLEAEQVRCGQGRAVCWDCLGEVLIRASEGIALCRGCGHTWPHALVDPCPWPATQETVSPTGQRVRICRSHATLWAEGG
jgi:hypothetical protein